MDTVLLIILIVLTIISNVHLSQQLADIQATLDSQGKYGGRS